MRRTINNFIGTHIYEIIENQKNPSIIGLSVDINNLLNDNNFFNNFKPNEIGDRIEKIQDILVNILGIKKEEVKSESRIMDDLGADSLDAVEIIVALEEEFGFEIPDDVADTMLTVADIISVVNLE